LIFKITSLFIFWFILGCSTPKKEPVTEKKEAPKINYGVTSNKETLFRDQSKKYGLLNITGSHFYAIDFNSDSYTDLVVLPDQFSTPKFYKFNPEIKKFESLSYSPFKTLFPASFLNFADLDRDGILDVLVGTFNQQRNLTPRPLRLFKGTLKNDQLKYLEVKNAFSKLSSYPTASAVFLDYDLDGNLDLYMGNWFEYRKLPKTPIPDKLFKGDGLKFSEVSQILSGENLFQNDLNAFINARPTMGVSICDVDKNGYPDILTSSSLGKNNKLWLNLRNRNTGKRIFIDHGEPSGYAMEGREIGGNSFYSVCGDYNGDLVFDILTGEFNYYYDLEAKDRSALLKGRIGAPKYIRNYSLLDLGRLSKNRADRRGHLIDFNNNSLPDLLIDNSGFPPQSRLYLLKQKGKEDFQNVSGISGLDFVNPSGTVLLDVNRDGLMDVVSGQVKIRDPKIKPRVYLFKNQIKNKNRSLRIFLRGNKSNKSGIGSLLTLKTSKGRQMKWAQTSYGQTPSQNEEGVHFGIKKGEEAINVLIKWPYKDLQVKKYSLKRYKFKRNLDLTLCESGEIIVGRPKLNSCL